MADKTTTLKTKTNDNVYPNVIGDNRKSAFVDSSTITHHFYDQTHKVGFQINNETNIKIQNSLQKPAGLTKTKLVGVGTNGQENIEIGDNLTLANGKLSATGGGSGGGDFDTITLLNDGSYTGTISGTKPVIIKMEGELTTIATSTEFLYNSDVGIMTAIISPTVENTTPLQIQFSNGNYMILGGDSIFTYMHFITLTKDNDSIYLQYPNSRDGSIYMDNLIQVLSDKKAVVTGVLGNSDETLATPLYVSGEAGGLEVYYVLKNDTSGTISHKSIVDYAISDSYSQLS